MRLSRERWEATAFGFAAGAAVLFGIVRAARLRWVCDDAFITFRYADNWIRGLGPVYNAGERVEGYTHFIWLCLIAIGRRVGIEPVVLTQVLGIAAYAATILLLARLARGLRGTGRVLAPMAALALAAHYDAAIWATGGLETALFTLLILLGFAALVCPPPGGRRGLAGAGLAFALAVLTRPDGVVPAAVAFAFVAADARADGRRVGRSLLDFAAPAILVLFPYLIWKTWYYGSILPNTFYAKSGGGTWFRQGFLYIGLYLRAYLSSFVFLLAVPALVIAFRRGRWRDDPGQRALLLSTAIVLAYLILFVAKVGGDFMYARFVLPVVPLILLAGELGIRRLLGRWTPVSAALLLAIPLLVFAEKGRRDDLYENEDGAPREKFGPSGITDEHAYYTRADGSGRNMIETYRFVGTRLARYFEGTNVRVVIGGQASLGYYARFAYCLERWGLTDPVVARMPVTGRTRPGHEKAAPFAYLIQKGIHFEFMKRPYRTEPYRSVTFRIEDGRIRGELYTWDRALMRHLRERFPDDVTFVDFEGWLDEWLRAMPGRPVEQVRAEYETLREFYFEHNDDPERERRIRDYIGAS
jgi:arabinofuranosyltransferase